jgi:hypothetical protein
MKRAASLVCALFALAPMLAAAEPRERKSPEWTPSLSADEPPAIKPWEDGASIAWSSTNGTSTVVADAVLKLERIADRSTPTGFVRETWGPGVYLHRNTDPAKQANDRGFKFSYGGLWFDNGRASGARKSWGWAVDAKAGKKLTSETVANQKVWFDKNSARATAGGQYVYVPSLGELDPNNVVPKAYKFLTGTARLYADRVSGGSGISGNVAGLEVGVRVDVAPWGLHPVSLTTALGVVPTLGLWAQYQSDFRSSGGRVKEERPLFGVKLQLLFSQLDSEGFVPGLSLERTIGGDVLTGREKSGVTKLVLSLKY